MGNFPHRARRLHRHIGSGWLRSRKRRRGKLEKSHHPLLSAERGEVRVPLDVGHRDTREVRFSIQVSTSKSIESSMRFSMREVLAVRFVLALDQEAGRLSCRRSSTDNYGAFHQGIYHALARCVIAF